MSAIVCIGVVIEHNMRANASNTFKKLLDRLKVSLIDLKDALPEYQQHEADQIKRMVIKYAGETFKKDGQHPAAFMSMLVAAIESEQKNVTISDRQNALEALRLSSLRTLKYWDRNEDKYEEYQTADQWMRRWEYV